ATIIKSVNMAKTGFPKRIEAMPFTVEYPFLILEKFFSRRLPTVTDGKMIVTRLTIHARIPFVRTIRTQDVSCKTVGPSPHLLYNSQRMP
ncbi:MAG: hypothetical protein RBR24_10050, partial [Candidatus Carbobacillus sp.]|nr:hypothetical protein [Candidatus Carbobacillus sp.]